MKVRRSGKRAPFYKIMLDPTVLLSQYSGMKKKNRYIAVLLLSAVWFASSSGLAARTDAPIFPTIAPIKDTADTNQTASEIILSFASAWRGREEIDLPKPITLGIWVDGQGHTVHLTNQGGQYTEGEPKDFDWGFETDLKTLQSINARRLNVLTAMGQARAIDPIPMQPRLPDNFNQSERIRSFFIPLSLRFWNKEWPEVSYFGNGTTRKVHGGNVSVILYDQGLRSAWYQLKPGLHINADPADQINDFDTVIVVTRGLFDGRLNGVERIFTEGEIVFIPAGMTHEFFATDSQYGEFIILMYGDGA